MNRLDSYWKIFISNHTRTQRKKENKKSVHPKRQFVGESVSMHCEVADGNEPTYFNAPEINSQMQKGSDFTGINCWTGLVFEGDAHLTESNNKKHPEQERILDLDRKKYLSC